MGQYYKAQIDSVYLTDDGTDTGEPCRVDITGLDALTLNYAGSNTNSADGTPYSFVIEHEGQGSPLRLATGVVTADVFEDLQSVINTALAADDTINLKLSDGPFGDFDLECLPGFPRPIEFSGKFDDDYIYDLALNLTVKSRN